jgi:hypothetical protein
MDDAEQKLAALQIQVGRLQAEVMALRMSGSYFVHALTEVLSKRGLVTPREVAEVLEHYAEGFAARVATASAADGSAIRVDVAETLRRQAAEVEKVVATAN